MGDSDHRQVPTPLAVMFTGAEATADGRLPHRLDLLGGYGFELLVPPPAGSNGGRASVITATLRSWRRRRSAPVTLAMFESEGHVVALLRSFIPRRLHRRRLVIVSCWLAELADHASPARRALYRWIYRGVDLVTVYSANQVEVLGSRLGIDRVAVVPFGIDVDEVCATPTSTSTSTSMSTMADGRETVLAVGRDAGRDWATLFDAVAGTGWHVELLTRQRQIVGLKLPAEVTAIGTEPRSAYLRRLAAATVVVIPTYELAYPSGQTVLLEAMALGKACVVTTTVALAEYTRPGIDCWGVPVGDAGAMRVAIDQLLGDDTLRRDLGDQAAEVVRTRFSAALMWAAVADRIRELLAA